MENRRAVIISLICFVISMILIAGYVQVRRSELTAEFGEEVSVVVATTTIPEYGLIKEGMVEVRSVFKKFREPNTVSSTTEVVGKSTFVDIYPGEQITLTKLVNQDGRPVLDRQVAQNTRAITVSIQERNGVAKLIRPGDRIDVLAAVNYDYEGQRLYEIKTVLQNIPVLATGKFMQNDVPSRINPAMLDTLEEEFAVRRRKDYIGAGTGELATGRPTSAYGTMTLQVSPDDAEKLIFLTSKFGDVVLYYTLRNHSDVQEEKIATVLLDDVLGPDSDYGLSKRKPPEAPPPRPPRFLDIQGGSEVPVY